MIRKEMNSDRKAAIIVGVLFLLGFAGAFSAIILKPILGDPNLLINLTDNKNLVMLSLVLAAIAFCLGALMYYYVFYQSKLIPRWLSGWGIVAIILHLTSVLLTMFFQINPFSTPIFLLLSIPIFFQELTLAGWLIFKGFNPKRKTYESNYMHKIRTTGSS